MVEDGPHALLLEVWNPDVDVDAVLDVFCERLFGKSHRTARELLEMMGDRWENTRFPAFRSTGRPDRRGYARMWPPEVVEKMCRLWDQARRELKEDPIALQRFEYFTWTFEPFVKEAREHQAGEAKK